MNRRLAIFLLAGACGGDSNNKPDAPHVIIDSPNGGMTMDVNGHGSIHFVTDTGVQDVNVPFSRFSILGVTPNGTSFDHTTGTGNDDGTFTVPVGQNAPVFYVGTQFQSNPPSFLVGNNTAPDLSSSNFGRPGSLPTKNSKVTVNATGLATWGAVDDFEVLDSNGGGIVFSPQSTFATKPKAGDTTITGQQFDWLDQPNNVLPDSGMGDTTVAFQLNTATGPDNYAAIKKIATAASFTLTDGGTATMTLAMTDVTQDQTLAVAWKRSQFEALKSMVGPGAIDIPGGAILAIEALPDATTRGFYGSCPDLVEFLQPGTTDVSETFTFGNPFKTQNVAWDTWVLMRYNFNVPLKAPGAATTTVLTGGCEMDIPTATIAANSTLAPDLVPMANVKVGGMDAFTAQSGVTQTPTLSWDAPATGTVIRYNITLNSLTKTGGASVITPVASFSTSGTTLAIPDQIMLQGVSYVAQIFAVTSDGLPQSFCNVVTAPFTP